MFGEAKPVVGNWANIVAAIRAMVAAGLCRVENFTTIIVGDDSAVRAYYAQMTAEREALRERGLFGEADKLLCFYQERSGSVKEAPYSLHTNIYGWAMGSLFLANLYGGRVAITDRGATLEECVRLGCDMARTKGTTLTFDVLALGVHTEQAAELLVVAGGTAEGEARVQAEPARRTAELAQIEARRKQMDDERAIRELWIRDRAKLVEGVRAILASIRDLSVTADGEGVTVRGKTYNPSVRCVIAERGFRVVRTDFDGVRVHDEVVSDGPLTECTVEQLAAATRSAWVETVVRS